MAATPRSGAVLVAVLCLLATGWAASPAGAAVACGKPAWAGSWSASPVGPAAVDFTEVTVRNVVHLHLGGSRVRVRFTNVLVDRPLAIGGAAVGLRGPRASVISGTSRPLTFDGRAATELAPGAELLSDPVDLETRQGDDLAISLHLPRARALTEHPFAFQESCATPNGAGDYTRDDAV